MGVTKLPGKRKKHSGRDTDYVPDPVAAGVGGRRIIIVPAADEPDAYRFMSKIREGRMSGEVFCRNPERRRELGLPIIYSEVD